MDLKRLMTCDEVQSPRRFTKISGGYFCTIRRIARRVSGRMTEMKFDRSPSHHSSHQSYFYSFSKKAAFHGNTLPTLTASCLRAGTFFVNEKNKIDQKKRILGRNKIAEAIHKNIRMIFLHNPKDCRNGRAQDVRDEMSPEPPPLF